MRGRKGVSAMPIRRPGIAGSAVAAMAGDHGLRSSRPGLKKPRKKKITVPGEIGEQGEAHQGRNGDGGGSESTARAEVPSSAMADPGDLRLRRLRASSVLGEHEDESGEQPGARGGSGSYKSRPRSERRAHDA